MNRSSDGGTYGPLPGDDVIGLVPRDGPAAVVAA